MRHKLYIGLILAFTPVAAQGMLPSSQEHILCYATSIVVGTVQDVVSRDCRIQSGSECQPNGLIVMKVRIDRVLYSFDPLEISQEISAETTVQTDAAQNTTKSESNISAVVDGNITFPLSGKALTTERVRAGILGRNFIFGLHVINQTPFYWTNIWNMDREPWVRRIWSKGGCAG